MLLKYHRLYLKIFLIFIIFFVKLNELKKLNKKYNGGLILYDPVTKYKILPPFVTSIKYRSFGDGGSSKFPLIGRQCTCKRTVCNCCAGVNLPQYTFNHTFCLRFSIIPENISLQMEFMIDDVVKKNYIISGSNPPPICYRINISVPTPFKTCVKFHDLKIMNKKISGCIDWIFRFENIDLFAMQFQCIELNANGVEKVGPNTSIKIGNKNITVGKHLKI